ncbi:saccharopine dehydrogenase b [Chytriomyces sp. MP71]|nr:saccharopine dehydrogenase b [Chytriomyces sp. MP71]
MGGAKEFEVLVLGATGFTGKYVSRDLLNLPAGKAVKWAMAGRSMSKLEEPTETRAWMGTGPHAPAALVIVDASDEASVKAAAARAHVVINCVGPFRFTGVTVVRACIEAGAHYVDISGEPEFVERILALSPLAADKGVTIVPCCGFDCIPAEFGNLFAKQQFAAKGYTCTSAEMFINLKSGPLGIAGNFATYESAVEGLANADELRLLRKKAARAPLPVYGLRLPFFGSPRWEARIRRWCVPFFGADAAIVRAGQQIVEGFRASTRSVSVAGPYLLPTQFNAYFCTQSIWGVAGLMLFGMSMSVLTRFKFGRHLLLEYPSFFSLGFFKKGGPTEAQIAQSSFESTFYAKGYKRVLSDADKGNQGAPDYGMTITVKGPEAGYVFTPIAVIACALQIRSDEHHHRGAIPRGVVTAGAAFAKVDLIRNLQEMGIQFTVNSECDL